MHMHQALLSIGLIVLVGKLAEGVLVRFGMTSILVYTATGILLGPVGGLVEPTLVLVMIAYIVLVPQAISITVTGRRRRTAPRGPGPWSRPSPITPWRG